MAHLSPPGVSFVVIELMRGNLVVRSGEGFLVFDVGKSFLDEIGYR